MNDLVSGLGCWDKGLGEMFVRFLAGIIIAFGGPPAGVFGSKFS